MATQEEGECSSGGCSNRRKAGLVVQAAAAGGQMAVAAAAAAAAVPAGAMEPAGKNAKNKDQALAQVHA